MNEKELEQEKENIKEILERLINDYFKQNGKDVPTDELAAFLRDCVIYCADGVRGDTAKDILQLVYDMFDCDMEEEDRDYDDAINDIGKAITKRYGVEL